MTSPTKTPLAIGPEPVPESKGQFAIGLASATATTIIAALQPVVMRFGAMKMDPLLFSAIAVGSAGLCGISALIVSGETSNLVRREYRARLFLLSISGTLATSLLLIYGLRRIDAVAAVILLETEPIYSLLLATIFLRERPSIRQIAATLTILAGIASVFGAGRPFSPLYAAALILITPLFWQISHVISLGVMPPLRPLCVTGARYIFAAIVLIVIVAVRDRSSALANIDREATLAACFTGAFIYFLGSLSWYGAISRLSLTWTTALVIPGVPILSFAFAIVFLGEHPSLRELIGIAIAILGVAALVTGGGSSRKSPVEAAEAAHQPLA